MQSAIGFPSFRRTNSPMDRLRNLNRRSQVSTIVFQSEQFNRNYLPVVMPIIPIIPSINTCMSLTTTTPTTSTCTSTPMTPKMPELNTNELQALADVCSNIVPNTALPSPLIVGSNCGSLVTSVTASTGITMTTDVVASNIATPMPNVMMNSLVSPTKIVMDEHSMHPMLANLAIPEKLPVACLPPPVSVIEELAEQGAPEAIEVEEDEEGAMPLDNNVGGVVVDEPMEEWANNGSPKQPSSLRSEDVVMAENLSVSGGNLFQWQSQ